MKFNLIIILLKNRITPTFSWLIFIFNIPILDVETQVLDLACLCRISVLFLIFCLQITNKKWQKLSLFVFKIKMWKGFVEIFALLIANWKKLMCSRWWLLNSSKATNWYNHPCYDNFTLTTFEGCEISKSESIPFAQSKNVAWTRKLVLEIASKVHYLVLFFSSQHKLFSSP